MPTKPKSVFIAYLLWITLGLVGGHRFYLRRANTGLAIMMLTLIGVLLNAYDEWGNRVGMMFIILMLVFLVIDLFLIPGMTHKLNRQIATETGRG